MVTAGYGTPGGADRQPVKRELHMPPGFTAGYTLFEPRFFSQKGKVTTMAGSTPVPHRVAGNLNDAWQVIAELQAKVAELEAKIATLKQTK